MADEGTHGGAPDTGQEQGQETEGQQSTADESSGKPTQSEQELLAELRKKNSEARNLRDRLHAIEAEKKAAEEAKLQEQQKFKELADLRQQELDEAKKRHQQLIGTIRSQSLDSALSSAIKAAGVENDALAKLVRKAVRVDLGDSIEFGDDHSVTTDLVGAVEKQLDGLDLPTKAEEPESQSQPQTRHWMGTPNRAGSASPRREDTSESALAALRRARRELGKT